MENIDDRLLYVGGGFAGCVVLQGLLGLFMYLVERMLDAIDHIRSMRDAKRREDKRSRRKKEKEMIGYLVSDTAMNITKVLAGMFNINPETQKDEFGRIYDQVKQQLINYETKADRQHRRVNPCSSFESF